MTESSTSLDSRKVNSSCADRGWVDMDRNVQSSEHPPAEVNERHQSYKRIERGVYPGLTFYVHQCAELDF